MKKIFKRIIAYVIDFIILSLLVSLISNAPFINKQLDNYNKYYDELMELTTTYSNFISDLNEYYENEELKGEDYEKLIKDNQNYEEDVYKYYEDGKLEKDEYENLKKDIEEDYKNKYIELNYKLEKNSTISYIIYLIITILYFGIFNLITKGQTLGKKILGLKIVKKDGTNPNIVNYLLRSILIFNSIYYLIAIIGVYTLNQDNFYTLSSITYEIQYYLQWIIIMMMIIRTDGRGLHDLIGNTKVIALDKEGNIIEDEPIFNLNPKLPEESEEKEEKKETKPRKKKKTKVIDAKIEEKE